MTDMLVAHAAGYDALLLRETNHRCANDLQLVVSLLGLQSRRALSIETRAALADAMERVAALARTRAAMGSSERPELETTLRQVCEALHSHAEPRGILISLEVDQAPPSLPVDRIETIALAVNELVTNAIKHAFSEGAGGCVSITVQCRGESEVLVTVDDDGLPLLNGATTGGSGLGFGLVERLIASVGGTFAPPRDGTKAFAIRVPC